MPSRKQKRQAEAARVAEQRRAGTGTMTLAQMGRAARLTGRPSARTAFKGVSGAGARLSTFPPEGPRGIGG